MENAPADRTEQPLPEEQRRADDREEAGHDDDDDGNRGERRDPADLAGDRRQFGLRQVDVRLDEADRGIAGREKLGSQAARRPARVRTRRGWSRGFVQGSSSGWRMGAGRARGRLDDTSAIGALRVADALRYVTGVTLRSMASNGLRHLLTAEILSIGTEITVGDTRDTNAGELARGLTSLGVRVARLTALPDDLDVVTEAFKGGVARADLVVSTGGLGPTPDDLTREAIAAAVRRGARRGCRPRGVAARTLEPAWDAVPRAEPQAGMADPLRAAAAQSERDGTRLARLPRQRVGHRRPAGPAKGDATDVGRPCLAGPARARAGNRGHGPDLPLDRDRGIAGRGTAWRGAPAGNEPDRGHLRAGRGGRCPDLGDRRAATERR